MHTINLVVTGSTVSPAIIPLGTRGSFGDTQLAITFDAAWDAYTSRTITFRPPDGDGSSVVRVIDNAGIVLIDTPAITAAGISGRMRVGSIVIAGQRADGAINTADARYLVQWSDGPGEGADPPTDPSVVQQVLSQTAADRQATYANRLQSDADAQATAADRLAVAEAKQYVDQSTIGFASTVNSAENYIAQIGVQQQNAVKSEGDAQVLAVQNKGIEVIGLVDAKKTVADQSAGRCLIFSKNRAIGFNPPNREHLYIYRSNRTFNAVWRHMAAHKRQVSVGCW